MQYRSEIAAAVIALVASAMVAAEDRVIQGVVTQWRPMITFAQPGDRIIFKNMIGHDTEAITGMIPDGATPWKSKMGEEGFNVKVGVEGAYVYKCNPHISTGMVGVILVGDHNPPSNLLQIEENLANVKVARNMVARALRKMKKALQHRSE